MDVAGRCREHPRPRFEMTARFHSARYEIQVENPDGVCRGTVGVTVDGAAITEWPLGLKMQDDGVTHHVVVRLGVTTDL